jgi:hypothetical protein
MILLGEFYIKDEFRQLIPLAPRGCPFSVHADYCLSRPLLGSSCSVDLPSLNGDAVADKRASEGRTGELRYAPGEGRLAKVRVCVKS